MLKLIPKALKGMPAWFKPPILQPDPLGGLGAQAVNFTRNLEMLLAAKEEAARRELEETRLRLIRNQPQLRATTKEELERARRRTREYEIKQKANELAAIFGRALGANHDMTVDEVNANTLNTTNLMGYMAAPYLMTALESGYYGVTGRPKEAAVIAGVGFGLPIVTKPVVQITKKLPNTVRSTVIANELKRDIKNTKLNEIVSLPGQIGWAPKQTFTGYHASNERTFNPNFWYENWARTTHNAPYGVYIAEGTAPTEGFLAKRPYVHNVSAELEKPMIQIGELRTNTKNSARNKVERFAQKQGADAIIFQDIKDNQMNHQNILKTLNPDTKLIINNRASMLSDISYKDPSTSSPEHTLAKVWDNYLTNPEQSSYLSDLTGLSPKDVVSIDFPQSTYDYFENSVFPRMLKDSDRASKLTGIDKGEFKMTRSMRTIFDRKPFEGNSKFWRKYNNYRNNKGTAVGLYNESNDNIFIDNTADYPVLNHEVRHRLQKYIPRTQSEEKYLRAAYKDTEGIIPNYDMSNEWETMNLDGRQALIGNSKRTIKDQNSELNLLSEDSEFIIQKLYNADGYWKRYIDKLTKDYDGPMEEWAKSSEGRHYIHNWIQAMKYVGVSAGIIGTAKHSKGG